MRSAAAAWRRFWLERPVAPEVLRLHRLALFGVLAVDMWLQVAHAARYGAGGFNVSHLPALDAVLPDPTRAVVAFAYVLMAFLAAVVALGGGGRGALVGLTALFGSIYFASQLDSYQHHYLIFWVLVLWCLIGSPPRRSWPVRLLLAQLSIVYLFAAVSKTAPAWWSGEVLAQQVSAGWTRTLVERLGGFGVAAKATVATELFLAGAIHVRRLRPIAAAIGIAFHVGIEASGFRIGLFSYFMIALYLLIVPERPLVALVRAADAVRGRMRARLPALPRPAWLALAAAGAAALLLVPLGQPAVAAAAVALVVALLACGRGPARPGVALAHLGAGLVVALLARPAVTDTARDYYRFWGGSARRLGDVPTAVAAYRRVVAVDPGYPQGHTSLASLLRRQGEHDRALAEAAIAQRLAPGDHRPLVIEAQIHDAAGDRDRARAAAERALALRPGDPEALRLAGRAGHPGGPGPGPDPGPDPEPDPEPEP